MKNKKFKTFILSIVPILAFAPLTSLFIIHSITNKTPNNNTDPLPAPTNLTNVFNLEDSKGDISYNVNYEYNEDPEFSTYTYKPKTNNIIRIINESTWASTNNPDAWAGTLNVNSITVSTPSKDANVERKWNFIVSPKEGTLEYTGSVSLFFLTTAKNFLEEEYTTTRLQSIFPITPTPEQLLKAVVLENEDAIGQNQIFIDDITPADVEGTATIRPIPTTNIFDVEDSLEISFTTWHIINADSPTGNWNVYDEGATTYETFPDSINLKQISIDNGGVNSFIIQGTVAHTIFISSDFSCTIVGAEGSQIIPNLSSPSSSPLHNVTGIIIGNSIASQTNANYGKDIRISGNTIISSTTASARVQGILSKNPTCGSLAIVDNSISVANQGWGVDIDFQSSFSTGSRTVISRNTISSNCVEQTNNIVLGKIGSVVSGNILISDNIISSYVPDMSLDQVLIRQLDSSSVLNFSNNIFSCYSGASGKNISTLLFTSTISGTLNIFNNTFTTFSMTMCATVSFVIASFTSSATLNFSNNTITSSGVGGSYGIYFTEDVSPYVTGSHNLFYWRNSTHTPILNGGLDPADFFDNGTNGAGENSGVLQYVTSYVTPQSFFTIFYPTSVTIDQKALLKLKLQAFLTGTNPYNNLQSIGIVNDLITNLS